jgi:hypothetical protein
VVTNWWHSAWNDAAEYWSVRVTVEATGVSEMVMMSVNEMEYVGLFGSSDIFLPCHLLMKIPSSS